MVRAFVSRPSRQPLLAGLVDRLWYAAPDPADGVRVEWVLPTCRSQMILSPHRSIFVGPQVVANRIERRTDEPMVGVSLAAGAASAFIAADGAETCGTTVALDAVMPVGALPDQLAEQAGDAALDGIETELVKRLGVISANPGVLAAERAIRSGQRAANISALLGVDRRSFVPEFRRIVGVAPRHYERICRFNRAIEAIRRPDAAPLAVLAAEQGFADQAHLSREVGYFARTSPSRMHRDGTDMINHLAHDKIFKT